MDFQRFGYEWYFDSTNWLQGGTNNTLSLPVVAENQMGGYTVVITNNYGSVTSQVAVLTVLPASIAVQPASQFGAVGTSASFSVTVAGVGPFGYDWYFGVTNLVESGTNNVLTLPNVTTNEAGNYTVVITNNYGSVTSQVAVLSVGFPPTVAVPPAGQTNLAGTSVSFSVTAGGTGPFTYQWQLNGTNLPSGIINTVAGGGGGYILGDGGAATNARLSWPAGVALDAAGNLYIADQYNQRIRKVTPNGMISTVAGNGNGSYSGDGGQATSGSLAEPAGVTSDAFGDLYIADRDNNRVREVTPNGLILTVAGNGANTFAGDGGAATNASLSYPAGVALDAAGNLFIADQYNQRVRRVDINGSITTVAGDGYEGNNGYTGDGGAATNASLAYPSGVAMDAAGNLYIADTEDQLIPRVDTNGIITTVAGGGWYELGDGGAATNAGLGAPGSVVLDAAGNLYVADQDNNRIRKVAANGSITTVAGNGSGSYSGDGGAATNAGLDDPASVAVDAAGNLYIADSYNNRIRKVGTNGLITTVAGNGALGCSGDGGAATNASLDYPQDVVVDAAGDLYIANSNNNRIRRVGADGFIITVAGNGSHGFYGDGGAATNASLWWPAGVAFDAVDNVYIADVDNNRVRKVLLFAGYPILTLNNLGATDAGNYAVVISSPYGSVTSAVVSLTVTIPTTPPQIIAGGPGLGFSTNQFGFNLNGTHGQAIVVDGSTNLLDWIPLFTNIANGSPFYFYDPVWTNFPWRFYRARLP